MSEGVINMDSTIIVALIGGGFTVINIIVTSMITRKKKLSEREKIIENGLQSLLRAEIIRSHEKYMDREYCPVYAREALTRIYESYHALGGNGTMTELYKQVMALPTDKEVHL